MIALLFFLSGCAALIYEIVWFQLLKLTIGSSALSLGITVSIFMGGMCIGSYLYHRFVSTHHHPLKAYAYLEAGIGIFAVINLFFIPKIAELYFSVGGYGFWSILTRSMVATMFLLPPTIFMGSTLPAIARWVKSDRKGTASLGLFYSTNIVGAVCGVFLAGFYLLKEHDVYVASFFATAINVIVVLIAIMLAKRFTYESDQKDTSTHLSSKAKYIYLIAGLSGFCALGAQIIWTRLLANFYGGTVYTFSIILIVFLLGLGIGSTIGSRVVAWRHSSFTYLFIILIAAVPAIWWAGYAINEVLHQIFLFGIEPNNYVAQSNWVSKSLLDFVRTTIALLPATIIWGASFPVALACIAQKNTDTGAYAGKLYAANTLGAVVGALLFSVAIIPISGTTFAQQMIVFFAYTAIVIFIFFYYPKDLKFKPIAVQTLALSLVASNLLFIVISTSTNFNMQLWGRTLQAWRSSDIVAIEEGVNSTVGITTFRKSNSLKDYHYIHISGKIVASNDERDMNIQRQLGHLPAIIHGEPKSALIIGFGAGVTAGTFTQYESIDRIVIVEIEPRVPKLSGKFFKNENYDVLNDPRTELIIDDGRHFLATTKEKFDIISTDPIHPWVRGASSLYTTEFYQLASNRLNPGGYITQWVPFYETDEAAVKSQVATFFKAFPNASIWNSQSGMQGYDVTLLGTKETLRINEEHILNMMKQPLLAPSLAETNINNIISFLSHYSGNKSDISNWLQNAELNDDKNLRLEYLAGKALDLQKADKIYSEMTSSVKYPHDNFILSDKNKFKLLHYFENKTNFSLNTN